MADDRHFALVHRLNGPRSTAGEPRYPYDYGVCLVEEDRAAVTFVDFEGISRAVGDRPCVPSVYGKWPGLVSIEAEREALSAIMADAATFSGKYRDLPAPWHRLADPEDGGLRVVGGAGAVSVEVADWLAEALGWHLADRVSLATDRGGSYRLYPDREGTRLSAADSLGWVSTTRSWRLDFAAGAPPLADGVYPVPHARDGSSVIFRLPAATPTPTADDGVVPEKQEAETPKRKTPLPRSLPIAYTWGVAALVALYLLTAWLI